MKVIRHESLGIYIYANPRNKREQNFNEVMTEKAEADVYKRQAQIGYAEINGNIVEVKSIDGFLNEKTPIIVSRITDGTIMVEKHRK